MEVTVDPLGQLAAYALDFRQFINACGEEPAQPAEAGKKPLPAFGSDALNSLQGR